MSMSKDLTKTIFAKKPVEMIRKDAAKVTLCRTLRSTDLIAIGIGAIIGAGIFVVLGVGSHQAGPAITVSMLIAGITATFAALCYSELSAMIPVAGSTYTYAYATLGEVVAWIMGWDLMLAYTLGASTVAKGFTGYLLSIFEAFGIHLPRWLTHDPLSKTGGLIDVPAALLLVFLTCIVLLGIQESARITKALVAIKLTVILMVIGLGIFCINTSNWHPYFIQGPAGILNAAGIMFFAFTGFEFVASTAEEAINPQKDLPIGILGSLGVCAILYVAMGAVLTGMVYFINIDLISPISSAFQNVNMDFVSVIISLGALTGFISVSMSFLITLPRLLMAMARDGLLPQWISEIHPQFKTPLKTTTIAGFTMISLAAFLPIENLIDLTVLGELLAFTLVCGGVLILRWKQPLLVRPFRCPYVPWIPALGVVSCLGLMLQMPINAWIWLITWVILGLGIYCIYGSKNSNLRSLERSIEPSD